MLEPVLAHFVMLLFATVMAIGAWYMAHNPAKALRVFTFGAEPAFGKRLGVAFCKACGWFLFAGMSAGVVLYIALIAGDLMRALAQ